MTPMEATHKTCSKCGEVKPLHGFHLRYGKPVEMCKPCACAKTREWAAANKEKKREMDKKYRSANPITKEQRRAAYLRNRETILARGKRYREMHPDRRKATLKKSELAHPETTFRKRARDSEKKRDDPELSRRVLRRQVEMLSNGYVKSLLTGHQNQRGGNTVSPELIALKREQIAIYRLARHLKQLLKKEAHESSSNPR